MVFADMPRIDPDFNATGLPWTKRLNPWSKDEAKFNEEKHLAI